MSDQQETLGMLLSGAISILQATLNQQQEAVRATDELLRRFTAKQAAGEPWEGKDFLEFLQYLQDRDDAVAAAVRP